MKQINEKWKSNSCKKLYEYMWNGMQFESSKSFKNIKNGIINNILKIKFQILII